MPAPRLAAVAPQQRLSIYRELLRECSYLPPAVRPTIQSLIQTRFHQHRKHDPRAQPHWERAQRVLRTLSAANTGNRKCMEGLISKAFGRTGTRRRQLMSEFVVPQGAQDTKALEALTSGTADATTDASGGKTKEKRAIGNPKNRFFQKWDQPKLLRLLASQRQRQSEARAASHLLGPAIKSTNPSVEVPKENIWGDPPAECVVNAKKARWWRRSADKMQPPLGKGEWELLGRLSRGAQESGEWRVPARRARAGADTAEQQEEESEAAALMRYAAHTAAAVERNRGAKRIARSGQQDVGPYGRSHSGSGLSPRWFRRAYARTWMLTPKMQQDPRTLQYKFTFGDLASLREATPQQRSIFDGVDVNGQPLKKSAS
ncbi:hypothetical protein ISF_04179 [Cordyceps fumosorosea ARSEF 2679]|uniref:LYR motif-containing protein Cup1-like N-terminal domain-containing protein n=1 Tax=Cordyceps fumosorosea (strain ARSEF 2679) TaxID=1081104 RepID=A0A167XBM1_CORFA|nr:hypothetical protein ISF_04179 [Cordyceps fumosorosea ARSEF 2679]OAA64769.1 hypothetical protein ISF_04179 [Cordyceps fumosorosea ARSEF 2679]